MEMVANKKIINDSLSLNFTLCAVYFFVSDIYLYLPFEYILKLAQPCTSYEQHTLLKKV